MLLPTCSLNHAVHLLHVLNAKCNFAAASPFSFAPSSPENKHLNTLGKWGSLKKKKKMTDSTASDSYLQDLFQINRQSPFGGPASVGSIETRLLWVAKNEQAI